MQFRNRLEILGGAVFVAMFPLAAMGQTTQTIRVVTYNTQGDVSSPSPTTVLPQIETVLEGIGQEKYVGDNILQLPDIIGLEETTSNSTTVAPIVSALNSYYDSDIFSYPTGFQASQSGGDTDGNGPNALIYNQDTLNLIGSVGVGTPEGSANGEYRQVARYEFQPLVDAGTGNGTFYVYVCHAKSLSSGSESTDQTYQEEEAAIIRNNEATLPASASVIYMGDWNVNASTDPSMVEMSSVGQGQAYDPLNPTNQSEDWAENSTYQGLETESDTDLRYRDDLQLVTSNVLNDSPGSLDYIANSEHAFGNNGGTAIYGSVNSSNNSALNDIIGNGPLTPSEVFNAMNPSTGSDHLPVVADYSIETPPYTFTWNNSGATGNGTTWDTTSQNWNYGTPGTYMDGSNVIFNDSNNGNFAVTLNTTVSPGSVTVNNSSGNYTISGTGTIAGTGSLTKTGTASLTLATSNSYSGGTIVNGGKLIVAVNGALPSNQALSIGAAGTVQLAAQTGREALSSLAIATGGTLDITNNHVIINYGASDPKATLLEYLATGANSGAWNGTGIVSSTAAATSNYGVAFADGADGIDPNLTSGQIEVAYAQYGDITLQGLVNANDFHILTSNFGFPTTAGWEAGDFLYQGTVNAEDFYLLASNFSFTETGEDASASANTAALDAFAAANGLTVPSNVPEPTGLLALATLGVLARRRRQSRSSIN
jgi:MYXO-CTERM domain-containing protein